MSTEYKKDVRQEFDRRLTMVPRRVLDRFTGKPILGGRDVKMGHPLGMFFTDVMLIAVMVTLIALAWTHLSPAWAFAASWIPTIILVERLRMMQTLYGHEASPGHDNFFPRGHRLRGYRLPILNMPLNAVMGSLATSIALSQNEEDYGADHGKHHPPETFGTLADPDAKALYDLGFRPGMSVDALWRQFWRTLVSPKLHLGMLVARARSNWHTPTRLRRGMTLAMASLLGGLAMVMPLGAWIAAVLLPWTVLFHISGLVQVLNRHGWLETRDGYETVEAYAGAMVGRFNGVPMPEEGLPIGERLVAYTQWGLEMLFELNVRLFTWSFDLQAHDLHHLEWYGPKPFIDDWTTMTERRQAAIDQGRDPYRMQDREIWGWRSAMRHSFTRLSQAAPLE